MDENYGIRPDVLVMFFLAALQNSKFLVNGVIFILFLSVFNGKCTGDVVCKPLLI